MTSERKFFVTTYNVQVFSENKPTRGVKTISELQEIMKVGTVAKFYSGPIGPGGLARKLIEQGHDPGQFNLDAEGNDLDLCGSCLGKCVTHAGSMGGRNTALCAACGGTGRKGD